MFDFKKEFQNKNILVTGGTGSIGSEIARQLLKYKPNKIRILARHEDKHYKLIQELHDYGDKLRFIVGDIRDKERLRLAMQGIDIVFHAAALKQVPICEDNPFEAVKTNILGTQNIIDIALEKNISKVISISTDKAVEPTNVMGASKLMAEKLMLASYYYQGKNKTKLCCVRFGNVLGSNGSILPLFKQQIKEKEEITITDPKMTRFIMSIPQAVGLTLDASVLMRGQEIFVLKMPALFLGDLANAAIELYSPLYKKNPERIKTKIIGLRKGEKMHEKLLTDFEKDAAQETENMYILTPQENVWGYGYKKDYKTAKKSKDNFFSSEHAPKLKKEEIIKLIKESDKSLI